MPDLQDANQWCDSQWKQICDRQIGLDTKVKRYEEKIDEQVKGSVTMERKVDDRITGCEKKWTNYMVLWSTL